MCDPLLPAFQLPAFQLEAITDPDRVAEMLRQQVLVARRTSRVYVAEGM
jgi:hypothetical protein